MGDGVGRGRHVHPHALCGVRSSEGHYQGWRWTHSPSLTILFVLSRKRVSFGDILWKTTFWMDDLPLLPRGRGREGCAACMPTHCRSPCMRPPAEAHEQDLGLVAGAHNCAILIFISHSISVNHKYPQTSPHTHHLPRPVCAGHSLVVPREGSHYIVALRVIHHPGGLRRGEGRGGEGGAGRGEGRGKERGGEGGSILMRGDPQ